MKSTVGQLLGDRYLIVGQLQQQPFHITYLAEDKNRKERNRCLVKRYRLSNTKGTGNLAKSHQFNKFLLTEIKRNYQFNYLPQIAVVLDYLIEESEFYLIREFIPGETLAAEIAHRRLEEPEVTHLIKETLTVLNTIHQAGIKHLNLKPSNIIFSPDIQKFCLTDFDRIQQLLRKNVAVKSKIRAATASLHNYYQAPEQNEKRADFCSDFYGLAVIAIKALTGKYPHEVRITDLDNYARASIVDPKTTQTVNISSQFAKILHNLLNPDTRSRYQSAREILKAIEEPQNVIFLPSPHTVLTQAASEEKPAESTPKKSQKKQKMLMPTIFLGLITSCFLLVLGWFLQQRWRINNNFVFVEYYNQNHNFTVKYPPQWQLKELEDPITGEIAVLTAPLDNELDRFQEKIYISVDNLATNTEESKAMVVDRINQNSNITNVAYASSLDISSDRNIQSITYQREQGNINLQQKEFFISRQNRVYLITFIAEPDRYEESLPVIEKVIDSFTMNEG